MFNNWLLPFSHLIFSSLFPFLTSQVVRWIQKQKKHSLDCWPTSFHRGRPTMDDTDGRTWGIISKPLEGALLFCFLGAVLDCCRWAESEITACLLNLLTTFSSTKCSSSFVCLAYVSYVTCRLWIGAYWGICQGRTQTNVLLTEYCQQLPSTPKFLVFEKKTSNCKHWCLLCFREINKLLWCYNWS